MRGRREDLDSLPQVAADPVVTGFNSQLAGLVGRARPARREVQEGHPEVQKIKAQIEQLKKAKQARAAQILDGLEAEYTQLRSARRSCGARSTAQKAQAANQSRKTTELEALRKEADSAEEPLRGAAAEAERDRHRRLDPQQQRLGGRPREPAAVPGAARRSAASRSRGCCSGSWRGSASCSGATTSRNTIRDPEEIERYLHLDLLAAVPRYEEENDSLATEAYQNLRTALIFARARRARAGGAGHRHGAPGGQDHHDREPGAGCSRARARRRWWWTATCGARSCTSGWACRASRASPTSSCARRRSPAVLRPTTTRRTSSRSPRGRCRPTRPRCSRASSSARCSPSSRREFEWVLIDSPPLASVTDALLLARHADHTVLVVQHNKVDKKLVKRSVAALRKVTPEPAGRRAERGRRARPQLPVLLLPAAATRTASRAQAAAAAGGGQPAGRAEA